MRNPRSILHNGGDFWLPNRKPVGPVEIDWSHPLAQGLVGCWLPGASNIDLVTGIGFDYIGSSSISATDRGLSARTTSVGYVALGDTDNWHVNTGSLCCLFKRRDTTGSYAAFCGFEWGSVYSGLMFQLQADNTAVGYIGDGISGSGGSRFGRVSNKIFSALEWNMLSMRVNGPSDIDIFVNGGLDNAGTTGAYSGLPGYSPSATMSVGRQNSSSYKPVDMAAVYLYNRPLSSKEHELLYLAPYQFLRPANDRIWVPVSGGGGVTGSSTSSSQNAATTAAGTVEVQATGTPASQNAATVSSGAVEVQATSVSATQNAATVASGTVGNAVTGSSISSSQNAATVASGAVEATATATPASQNAATTASGAVEVTATGTASSQNAATVATGTAQNGSTGTAIASSQNAAVTAAGTVEVTVVAVATSTNCSQTVASGTSDAPVPSSGSGGPEPLMGDEWDFLRDAATPKRRKTSKRLEKKKAKKAAQKSVSVQQQLVTSPQADAPVEQTPTHEIPAEIKQAVDQARDINKVATVEGIEAARQKRIAKRRREEEMLMVALLEVI